MTKWRCPIIKNDPSLAETEDLTLYVHYPTRTQWRVILGGMVALNVIVFLTIGGIV